MGKEKKRWLIEWINAAGQARSAKTILEKTARDYAKLLKMAHGFEAVVTRL